MVKRAIAERHEDSVVLTLKSYLNERRNKNAFHLREVCGDASAAQEIGDSGVPLLNVMCRV